MQIPVYHAPLMYPAYNVCNLQGKISKEPWACRMTANVFLQGDGSGVGVNQSKIRIRLLYLKGLYYPIRIEDPGYFKFIQEF